MKKYLILLLVVFSTTAMLGQDFDSPKAEKPLDCSDIAYNSSMLFVKYMSEHKIDSAKNIVNYWEAECGLKEPVYRAKMLLALETGQFNESLLSEKTFTYIYDYQNRMKMITSLDYSDYNTYKSYYGFVPPAQDFDNYTRKLALALKSKYPEQSDEYILSELYSDNHDVIFSKLQSGANKESFLIKQYNATVKKYENMIEYNIAGIIGLWKPTGDLKKVGVHPELGLQLGVKRKKMNYDLTLALRFINSPNELFIGEYIGFDIGRDIYAAKGHGIQIIAGIALDGFEIRNEDGEDNMVRKRSAYSYNLNFGLAYRYYITNSFYIGLRAKYNIVDYTLNKAPDLAGNVLTLQFTVGKVDRVKRNESLKLLKRELRK